MELTRTVDQCLDNHQIHLHQEDFLASRHQIQIRPRAGGCLEVQIQIKTRLVGLEDLVRPQLRQQARHLVVNRVAQTCLAQTSLRRQDLVDSDRLILLVPHLVLPPVALVEDLDRRVVIKTKEQQSCLSSLCKKKIVQSLGRLTRSSLLPLCPNIETFHLRYVYTHESSFGFVIFYCILTKIFFFA